MNENRIERLGRPAKSGLFLVAAIVLFALIEVLAWTMALAVLPEEKSELYSEAFHPIWTGEPLIPAKDEQLTGGLYGGSNLYDPWYGHRPRIGSQWVNKSGFLHDGNPDRDLRTKGDRVYRIFVLGGSTVAGHDIPDKMTISAQLERYLNSTGDSRTFEVVNAGVQGYYSPQELGLFLFEVVHLQPDAVIAFDGYNDLDVVPPKLDKPPVSANGPAPTLLDQSLSDYERYHWSGYHRYLFNLIVDTDINEQFTLRIPRDRQIWRFLYTTALISDLLKQSSSGALSANRPDVPDEAAAMYPGVTAEIMKPVRETLWRQSDFFEHWLDTDELATLPLGVDLNYRSEHYASNLGAMAGAANNLGIKFLGVLQPLLLPGFKPFSNAEQFWADSKANSWADIYGINYREMMLGQVRRVRELGPRYAGADFRDYTRLFANIEDTTYVDWVHYNPLGTQLIAERLGSDILAGLNQ